MGHEFARAALAAALACSVAACGSTDRDVEPPPVLDNAREQVATATSSPSTSSGPPADSPPDSVTTVPSELPPPDPSTFDGANRVVNLWVGPAGETTPIDVWGRRTFTNGPVLLAEDVAFATASDYFAAPSGYDLVVVSAGAGPDGAERAGMFNAVDGEQITLVFTNGDDVGGVAATDVFERGRRAPEPPADGTGLVVMSAANLQAFSATMIESVGGDAFFVGDGTSVCRPQRIEADGFPPNVLGGTQQVEFEVAPGPAAISLHPWFSADGCDQPSVLDLTVEVGAGDSALVLVYSRDGVTVDALILPVARVI